MTLPGYVVIEAFPFNGPDDPDSALIPVDITAYVNDNLQLPTSTFGRQTDLSTVDPGQFTIVLNNQDDRFTPGNTTSPYYPGWRTGMRLRMRETIGYRTFTLADGNMLQPAVTIQTPGSDQTVTVVATDRIGRLQQGRRFIGTLAEYILYNGGDALWAYYPCNESLMPLHDVSGNSNAPPLAQRGLGTSSFAVTSQAPLCLPGQGSPVLADDTSTLTLEGGLGVNAGINVVATIPDVRTQVNANIAATNLPSGQYLTVVVWVNNNPPPAPYDLTTFGLQIATLNATMLMGIDGIGRLNMTVSNGFTGSANTGVLPLSGWTPIAIRYSWSAPSVEVWVGSSRYSVAISGSPPASDHLSSIIMPQLQCSLGHVQVYLGTAAQWDIAQMTSQIQMAQSCLAGQYTGQRIETAALYAGIASGELSAVDTGISVTSRASLAGKTALDVMREAETTEQGLLHAYGRQLVFHDRTRRYNR